MTTELTLKPHSILSDTNVVEVTHNGRLICTIYGAEGPGVRIISKHLATHPHVTHEPTVDGHPGVYEVILEVAPR